MNTKDDKQERQVVSRQRVADHGEVYTAKREVNAMLDLVKEETERIDSRFLEPACGNGNFLVEILNRKMEAVRRQHSRNRFEYDQASAVAVSSMYGVELLPDNVEAFTGIGTMHPIPASEKHSLWRCPHHASEQRRAYHVL